MLTDIAEPALEKAKAKVLQLVPEARVETKVREEANSSTQETYLLPVST